MDPALRELLLAEDTVEGREVEAIIRFRRPGCVVPGVRVVAAFGRVATCRVPANAVPEVRRHPDVVSLKAPRRLGPDHDEARAARGEEPEAPRPTDARRSADLGLTGAGVVVGVVDWGLDVDFPSFKNRDGTTRLLALWDQRDSATGARPARYGYGAVHDRARIDRALRSGRPYTTLGYHPGGSDKGNGSHGTHVTDIAAGNGRGGGPQGVAPGADLVFVHLADRDTGGLANLGDSVRLLEGIDFIARTAGRRPWVINLSVGRHGGPHDGSTLTELALDELLRAAPGRFVVQSTGNYYRARAHARGVLARGGRRTLTFRTDPSDTSTNELELWYDGGDRLVVHVQPPGAAPGTTVRLGHRVVLRHGDQVIGRVYHRARDPNNGANHVDAFLYPRAPAGDWRVTVEAEQVRSGRFDAWLERDEACRRCQSRFVPADSDPGCTTGTIANGRVPLVVGAYDAHDRARPVAPFSSAGPTRDRRTKPDLAAPGMSILAARSAAVGEERSPGRLIRKSGSSMAAPHVTGAVALCLQAGAHRLDASRLRRLVLGTATPPATTATDADRARLGSGYLDLPALTTAVRRQFPPPPTRPTRADPREHAMQSELESDLDPVLRLAQSPARAYRELMYRPQGELARWIGSRFDVVGPPGQPLADAPRAGDVFLRVALGTPGVGRCSVLDRPLARPPVMPPGELLLRPRTSGEDNDVDADNRPPVVVDTAAAVPAFAAAERVRVVTPLLSQRASTDAAAWSNRVHPASSGVLLAELRGALARYVDAAAVQAAIQAQNQRDPAHPIDASSPTTDAVLVESVHQFQVKCYADRTEHDGRAGESTLDSLGLIARSGPGMRQSDRSHAGALRRLRARDTEVKGATGNEFSADNWFDQMCDPSVLGVRTKLGRGLHIALVRRLRTAERHLLTLPAFQGMTPVQLGAALGLSEKHGGARPTQTDSTSVHTFGLAVDIAYTGNPWVRRATSWAAVRRAAALVSGVTLRQASAPAYFSSLGSDPARSTGQVWDELRQRSGELASYLGLRSDATALRAALATGRARGTPGLFEPGETLDAAVGRWRTRIDRDRRELMAGDFDHHDPPERGFLTHHRDLVIALRDHACLAWGAVDLGPGASGSGDVMHFDMRVDGVGRVLTVRTPAFVPTVGHPCLARPAQAEEVTESDEEDTAAFVARLQKIWDRMFGADKDLAKVRVHALQQAPSTLIANSGYAAWTNSPTAVYVAPNPNADTTYWEVVLHHESLHVKQFLGAKRKPPQTFETMMDYECKAYTESHRWFTARKLKDPNKLAKQLKTTADTFCVELRSKHPRETPAQREERFKRFMIRHDLLPGDVRLLDLYAPTDARYRNPDKAESVEADDPDEGVEDAESRVDTAKATIRAQATRWGTDETAIMNALRALIPTETAQVLADGRAIEVLVSELSGADLAAVSGLLARGRVGSMARTDVARILADPTRHTLGTLAAATARDVLLGHQEAFDRTGTGTIHGSHCPIARPTGATTSDCTEYVKDVLGRTFDALGRGGDWTAALAEATRRSRPSGLKGTEVIRALQTLQGWQAVFWSPDPTDPSDGDQEHPYAYRIVRRDGTYYRIAVDRNRSVVNYRRTNAANPTDTSGIDCLRRLQFGVLAARGGMHMAMVVNAEVYEVHWSSPATDRNAVEATPLTSFAWLSGAIAAPAGDIDLAWRTP